MTPDQSRQGSVTGSYSLSPVLEAEWMAWILLSSGLAWLPDLSWQEMHSSVLKTTEELLGLPPLATAVSSNDLSAMFAQDL